MKKKITVLGATGSIGKSTFDLLQFHKDRFEVVALSGGENVKDLIQQALLLKPQLAVIKNPALYNELKEGLLGSGIETAAGEAAVVEAASLPADTVVSAILGTAGLLPTLEAIKQGRKVALANKESLVAAGSIMLSAVENSGAKLLPVDSEHSAIFQSLEEHNHKSIEKIILTASGGPFYNKSLSDLTDITPEQAIKHPNWSMGAKISVDSATLMNKGLELIEAHYFFNMPESKIEVLIHPQSIIHSLVAYEDGSVLAQLGMPDMRTPIAYTLAWPERIETKVSRLSLADIGSLTFFPADDSRFAPLRLAREALRSGKTLIYNTANEVAVQAFLNRQIGFLDIMRTVEKMMETVDLNSPSCIEEIVEQDCMIRQKTKEVILMNFYDSRLFNGEQELAS
jgi:1-deoxy-D-xylulose-5-phosphate reductoisomerase